jgi:hypothetical protein
MITKTFAARIENGQLRFQEPLTELEGCEVQVTVVANGIPADSSAPTNGQAEPPEPEPPEWLDVEKDIYIPMPYNWVTLENVKVIDLGRAEPPQFILPEELPDE